MSYDDKRGPAPYPFPDDQRIPFHGGPPGPTFGILMIALERKRQIEELGYTPDTDCDRNESGDLTYLSYSYTRHITDPASTVTNKIECLAKAGALIAAEIDRAYLITKRLNFQHP